MLTKFRDSKIKRKKHKGWITSHRILLGLGLGTWGDEGMFGVGMFEAAMCSAASWPSELERPCTQQ
jgi:hypothetical protein